jgi:hypothetical protein
VRLAANCLPRRAARTAARYSNPRALAFWFTFVGYRQPTSTDPRRDVDLASYGLVSILPEGRQRLSGPGLAAHWPSRL